MGQCRACGLVSDSHRWTDECGSALPQHHTTLTRPHQQAPTPPPHLIAIIIHTFLLHLTTTLTHTPATPYTLPHLRYTFTHTNTLGNTPDLAASPRTFKTSQQKIFASSSPLPPHYTTPTTTSQTACAPAPRPCQTRRPDYVTQRESRRAGRREGNFESAWRGLTCVRACVWRVREVHH